jgi:hypothetical protein
MNFSERFNTLQAPKADVVVFQTGQCCPGHFRKGGFVGSCTTVMPPPTGWPCRM